MNRRDALRGLAGAAAMPLLGGVSISELVAIGRKARAAMRQDAPLETLSAARAETVRVLAEIVLPRTETPGATDAGVTEFIDTMLTGWMDPPERDAFLAGLDWLDERAGAAFGAAFVDGDSRQQLELATTLDGEVADLLEADGARLVNEYIDDVADDFAAQAPRHFFYRFKQLVLTGYFTSAHGMNRALGHSPFPGRWDPCVPVEPEVGP